MLKVEKQVQIYIQYVIKANLKKKKHRIGTHT